jgi:cobalamin biosynthesis Mg chelatase CobN
MKEASSAATVAPLPEKGSSQAATDKGDEDDIEYIDTAVHKVSNTEVLTECPGVCVAPSISEYCDAVLARDGICKGSLRCCVTREVFKGQNPPNDLVLNNSPSTQRPSGNTQSQQQNNQQTINNNNNQQQQQQQQQSTPTKQSSPSPSSASDKIPLHKRCKGTCVGSFFTFLCDQIDTESLCPSGGQCCMTREDLVAANPQPRPSIRPNQQQVSTNRKDIPCSGR